MSNLARIFRAGLCARLGVSAWRAAGAGANGRHQFLPDQQRHRQWRQSRRPRRRRQSLPDAGAGGGLWRAKTWRAYLSTQAADGAPAVNARDRIGKGPWQNSKGVVIAKDVAELHSASNNLTKQTALTEKGEVDQRRRRQAEPPRRAHGIAADGTAFAAGEDRTCKNWTSSYARRGDGRAFRPQRAARRRTVEILEYLASLARPRRRLLPGRPEEHRRRRPAVLLRGELSSSLAC